MKALRPLLLPLLMLLLAPCFTGCAGMGASSTEPLLSAAGFRVQTPDSAKQRELFDALPSYRLQRGKHEGKTFYAYKDEKQGVAYVGGEKEYQKYQELAIQRRIARDQYQAAQMNRMTAYHWYGAYRPGYYGFY
jgi:hypothetical protein